MKKPIRPPNWATILEEETRKDPSQIVHWLADPRVHSVVEDANNHAWNWEECGHRAHLAGLTAKQFWLCVKLARGSGRKMIPLRDIHGLPFSYQLPPLAHRVLHLIDTNLGGSIGSAFPRISSEDDQKRYLLTSLREEAISSSLIEGAVVTREVAKSLLRESRRPRSRHEQMVANNYRTIRMLNLRRQDPMTPELLCEVQRSLTEGTLDTPDAAGRFRNSGEPIAVWDHEEQEPLFTPPPAGELPERIRHLCDFANRQNSPGNSEFLHPAIRAIVLHFWLAYDHPFVDGNGRTARALFYWSLLRDGYWLAEYISISSIIHTQPKRYARAYLDTETDERDLTYFLLYHLHVVERGIEAFRRYFDRKVEEQREQVVIQTGPFNSRQRAILLRALRDSAMRFTFESHAGSHGVSIPTARSDLMTLEKRGLLIANRHDRRFEFLPAPDLEARLRAISERRGSS